MSASAWTTDRVERLRALWAEGRTAEQIARELDHGISRSAVLGKVYRLGLSEGRPGRSVARKRPPRRPRRSPGTADPSLAAPPPGGPAVDAGWIPGPPADGPDILSVRRGQCRWPYGEPEAGLVFCGQAVARGVFCAAHARLGYREPREGAAALLALAGLA